MAGTFDSVGTLITDLANASINVVRIVLTGDNAGVIITGIVVLVIIIIFLKIPDKIMGHYKLK